jgi:FtsZ-binding cell division protein ZapB
VADLEKCQSEIMRLKKENNRLDQEKLELKVAAEKYQKRAIYTRKKFAEL